MTRISSVAAFALLLLLGHLLPAAVFVTADCGPAAITSGTDTSTGCHTLANTPAAGGGASAFGQVSLSLASDPSNYSVLTTHQTVQAVEGFPLPNEALGTGSAGSSSHIQYQIALTTPGPERPGYLQIAPDSWASLAKPYDGSGGASFGLDIHPYPGAGFDSGYTSITCTSAAFCSPGPAYFADHFPYIQVTLGTTFNLFVDANLTTYVNRGDGSSGGSQDATFGFRFYETLLGHQRSSVPVMEAAPEPGTIGMLGGGLILAALYSRWRAKVVRM
jgi:hypothetical protein